MREFKSIALVALLQLLIATGSLSQSLSISGAVKDAESGEMLIGASVRIESPIGTIRGAATDSNGEYHFNDLADSLYTITISYIGYEPAVINDVRPQSGIEPHIVVELDFRFVNFNEIVVQSVSRKTEKIVGAPAGVSIVEAKEIESRPALTIAEHVIAQPGVDVMSTGLNQHKVSIRGFNSVISSFDRLLILIDNRNTSVPSLRHNLSPFLPTINEDVQRIELVRGPGSALYGPNAANGVMHIITRSPFESQGTFLSVGAGERDLVSFSGRHASVLSPKTAFKISGQYYQGTDWKYADPNEPDSLTKSISTVDGPVTVGDPFLNVRDFDIEGLRAEARFDYRHSSATSVIISGSYAGMKNINLTDVGAMQNGDWRYAHLQARILSKSFFAQAFMNKSLGEGNVNYLLRTGDIVRDKSAMYSVQIQNTSTSRILNSEITYGLDSFYERAESEATVNGRFEDDDDVFLLGAYAQAYFTLSPRLSIIAAARVDKHNRLENPFFSPRVATVYVVAPGHSVRATYNRAFTTPSSSQLFLDLRIAKSLGPLPYGLQALRTPETGYHFKREAGGGVDNLFMQSPFNPAGNTDFIPAEATSMWPVVVELLAAQGIDLSGVPSPGSDQVATRLGLLNTSTFAFDTVSPTAVKDIDRPKPGISNSFEVGYKGIINERLFVESDFYYTRVENFVSLLDVQTPNVFLDGESLASYLQGYMPSENALALADIISAVPLGTISPIEVTDLNPADIILTFRNFDTALDLFGTDLSVYYLLNRDWTVSATYSYVSDNLFPKTDDQLQDIALNAPKSKVGFRLLYQNNRAGIDGSFRFRYIDSFPVRSGVYQGVVDSYSLVDFVAGARLPFSRNFRVSVVIQNILDLEHSEYIGAPEMGRLASVYLSANF